MVSTRTLRLPEVRPRKISGRKDVLTCPTYFALARKTRYIVHSTRLPLAGCPTPSAVK